MKLQCFSCRTSIVISKSCFSSGELANRFQVRNYFPSTYQSADYGGAEFMSKLLDRRWTLPDPSSKLNQVIISNVEDRLVGALQWANCFSLVKERGQFSGLLEKDNNQQKSFYIVRDDLLHPLINGNKARKLDALLPLVEDQSVTDVVTCGGCQSAHAAATAVLFAERGLKTHLLLRGEQPETLTGYNLVSTMYGNVTYVARSIYADREKMMRNYADLVAGSSNVVRFSDILSSSSTYQEHAVSNSVQMDTCRSVENHPRKIVIISEGAGDAVALLGLIRLVEYLSQDHLLGKQRAINFVVDAGTGTTAIGLGLGAAYLGLPWEITAVMLADTIDGYKRQEKRLISDFNRHFNSGLFYHCLDEVDGGIVRWVERCHPRKFGNILEGEVEACKKIAQSTGILVDPVYTLAAWEMATVLCQKEDKDVVMLHTGGTLGMFGLAQRKTKRCRCFKPGELLEGWIIQRNFKENKIMIAVRSLAYTLDSYQIAATVAEPKIIKRELQ